MGAFETGANQAALQSPAQEAIIQTGTLPAAQEAIIQTGTLPAAPTTQVEAQSLCQTVPQIASQAAIQTALAKAAEQIESSGYASAYEASGKSIYKVAVVFDVNARNIAGWQVHHNWMRN